MSANVQAVDTILDSLHNLHAMIHAIEDGGLSDADQGVCACYGRVMREQVDRAEIALSELNAKESKPVAKLSIFPTDNGPASA